MRYFGRGLASAGALVGALVMAAVPAAAHECYNTSRAERANAVIAQHAHGWVDMQVAQLAGFFVVSCVQDPSQDCGPTPPSLTAEDIAYIEAASFEQLIGELLGFAPRSQAITDVLVFTGQVVDIASSCFGMPTHFLTLANATAAGGAPGKVTSNAKGIDHFPEAWGAQLGAAFREALVAGPAC